MPEAGVRVRRAAAAAIGSAGRKGRRSSRPRATLSLQDAKEIIAWKGKRTATDLGIDYGVSEKAIRDVWNGRTWVQATKSPSLMSSIKISPPQFHLPYCSVPSDAIDVINNINVIDFILGEWDRGRTTLLQVADPFAESRF
mmetsp:Transcript_45535/g.121107  ORF Transcript_45535/g.121107 Transcript_45535/m.121107 type:complete len:141 (+) Transcript_45535:45-467(+)